MWDVVACFFIGETVSSFTLKFQVTLVKLDHTITLITDITVKIFGKVSKPFGTVLVPRDDSFESIYWIYLHYTIIVSWVTYQTGRNDTTICLHTKF